MSPAPSSSSATSNVAAAPATTPSAVAAADTSTPSSASTCAANGGTEIQIGYPSELAYLAQVRDEPTTRVQALLQKAFPRPDYQLVFKSYFREDLPRNVASGRIDLAIVELGPDNSVSSKGTLGLPLPSTGVKVVTIPGGYTVMAAKSETDGGVLQHVAPWAAGTILLIVTLVISAFLLSVVAYVLNFQPPSSARWSRSVVTLVDPALSRWSRALNWMFTTTNGGTTTALWCLAGVCILLLQTNAQAYTPAFDPKVAAVAKMDATLSSQREIYAFRSNAWVKCRRTESCLRDYASNELNAILLGDRDTLCWYANQMELTPSLEFIPNVVVPRQFAFILPDSTLTAHNDSSYVATRLEKALKQWPISDSPMATCGVPIRWQK